MNMFPVQASGFVLDILAVVSMDNDFKIIVSLISLSPSTDE